MKLGEISKLGGYWQRNIRAWTLALAMILMAMYSLYEVGYKVGQQQRYRQALQQAEYELALQVQILESRLEKYRLLPVLLGRHGDQIRWLEYIEQKQEPNIWLQQLNYLSGAQDVLLLTENGQIIASARNHTVQDYSAPALEELALAPIEGKLGRRFIMVGQDSLLYGFSSLLRVNSDAPVILVFLVDLAPIVESWSLSTVEIIAYDENGTVTLSSQQHWHRPTESTAGTLLPTHATTAKTSVHLNTLGWKVEATQTVSYSGLIQQWLIGSILVCIAILLIFTLLIRRREFQVKAELRDKLYAAHLEQQINDRTVELQSTNIQLTREIQDRIQTEEQLKTTQQELIHSTKLATIGQMSTTLSHEYNQPLAAMRTYAENAQRFLSMKRVEPAIENLQRIIKQTDRLGDLSKVLMSFARKPSDEFTKVNLHACVEEAFMLVRPRIKLTPIYLSHEVPETLFAFGNPVQVSQMLLNLLTNAIDAIQEKSEHLNDEHIELRASQNQDTLLLVIEDSGLGIAAEQYKKIFEPFVTTKKNGKGLGLGLSVVKDIIKDHHGTMTYQTSSLGGARFNITLKAWNPSGNEKSNE